MCAWRLTEEIPSYLRLASKRALPSPACSVVPNTEKSERCADADGGWVQEMCQKRKPVIKRERVIMETIIHARADL